MDKHIGKLLNWEELMKNYNGSLPSHIRNSMPFLKDYPFMNGLPNMSWVDGTVKEMMERSLSGIGASSRWPGGKFGSTAQKPSVFESHRSVFVRVPVGDDIDQSRIRLFTSPARLRIQGLGTDDTLNVPLPTLIDTRKAFASLQEGILEVRMPKSKRRYREREIFF